ncbi:phosphodiester glycosidase family protein [Demequina capsici]|uniref:Phosphodiester glycosidase family protein n=1 Tax=Demequina capsici TaxID=3075620 RepID=A0AA96FA47_9MICO|nr:phosphodiester glycosidase family protein [Demequina sp. PMTSA13]WNM26152.1 phosphodiester glycosidase family protein [Demequina sp. PMTSA13]
MPTMLRTSAALALVMLLVGCAGPQVDESSASPSVTTPSASGSETPFIVTTTEPAKQVDPDSAVQPYEFEGVRFSVARLDLSQWDIRVVWDGEKGGTYLGEVDGDVLTNAGIFTPSYVPGGLLVSDGQQLVPLNLNGGEGNFHLLPNGVFAIMDDGTAEVVDSMDYSPDGVMQATQSGPALVLDGVIHPAFTAGSTNVAFRSGVGVSADGRTVYLAISDDLVNFDTFARMFRDGLGASSALYLDGQISGLWAAGAGRDIDLLLQPYAGIIAATRKG